MCKIVVNATNVADASEVIGIRTPPPQQIFHAEVCAMVTSAQFRSSDVVAEGALRLEVCFYTCTRYCCCVLAMYFLLGTLMVCPDHVSGGQ